MDEIEYKLDSRNPVLISHAISKLFDSIKKKRNCQTTDHISKVTEFKLLLAKRDSSDATVSISACQALITLVENGLWDISEALSTFASSLSTIKNYVVATTAISQLLLLDLKYSREDKTIYPFTLHVPQHPFIMILNRDKHSWRIVLNEMTSFVNHRDPQIRENSINMLRPVFLYILCNPSMDSLDCCVQPVCWQLLINSKRSTTCLQTEILLWMCTAETYTCININYRILEFAEKAMLEKDKQCCTALSLMIVSLTTQLLKHGSDPKSNFEAISTIIDECDTRIGNLMLALMAEIITLCPAIYLHSALQICTMIINKMLCSDIFLNTLMASVLKWMAYPSILCSDALDMATNWTKKEAFTKAKYTDNDDTAFSSQIFAAVTHSDSYVQFYGEMVHSLSIWKSNDILPWLKNMSRVPIDLKDKCKLLLSGLFLQTNDPQVAELSCNILVDISRETKSFESHVLSLVLHKLAKSRNSTESKCLLLVIPELIATKENVPIVTHTLDTLLNGDKQLKYFAVELYLKTLRKEPRCYRFVSAAIIRLMKSDHSWYSDATCARAIKYICENHSEHGETLVPLLSQILNRSTDTNGGTASALALNSISALCKASVIDICSTWRILAPKMEKEKRIIVLESLCELFGDITAYPSFGSVEEHDKLIDDIVSNLWKYTTHNNPRIIDAALRALASYSLENIPLKALPADFRCNLVLPAAYTKTPIDADKKPEDVLPYIPGTCWIQMLQKINKTAISAAGDLLISFVTKEVNSFPSRIYVWPQGEPQNFKYLPEKSIIRAVGEYLRRCNKSDSNNHRIITECLRILAHKYPKPLPNINWSFLKDAVDISPETKEYTLSIACHHSTISLSATTFVENYLLTYKSITDSDLILKQDECRVFYSNLEDLCQAVQPNIMKPFLETTLEYVIKKINVDDQNSINMFHRIMSSYARTLQNQQIHDSNSTLLATILEKLLDKIDLTCNQFGSYFTAAALKLSTKHLERMTSPKVWWEITSSKLKNAIAIRAELALKERSEFPLSWLNEIIDETASIPSVQTYFLGVIQKLQAEMQYEKSVINWVIEIMTQIQGLLVEPSQEHCNKAQFHCNILLVSVISLSGIDCMLMKQDLLATSQNIRVQLFPLALAVLSLRQDWKHVIPQIMEWINCMRTSTIPNIYKSMFHKSLIYLKHNPYYKDVWAKYLSIKTEIDI